MAQAVADITTDYLVVGSGFAGLCFVDELLTRTSATVILVDERDAPRGHWNDVYPFVRLHGPSTIYGVESKELSDFRIDEHGPNKGLMGLATGAEVIAYCQALMKNRFLPSGRVTYLPSTHYETDGALRGVHSGKCTTVNVRKRVVDAKWYTNNIPLKHTRSFGTAPDIKCIPPNFLQRSAPSFNRFTVLGGGKTGMDSCLWLLTNGVDSERLRWIIPNDYWYVNRARVQNGVQFFNETFTALAERNEALATATDHKDMAHGFEKCGFWHRLDPNVEPRNFHAALVSKGELEELRKIREVIRQGYVTKIDTCEVVLTLGTIPAEPDTLYIDCTASAVPTRPLVPLFQPGKIVLQIVRSPAIGLSSAIVAFLESLSLSDEERNKLVTPVSFSKNLRDHVLELAIDMRNRQRLAKNPDTRRWIRQSRLDGFSRLAASVQSDDKEKLAILVRLHKSLRAAGANLPRLLVAAKLESRL